MFELIGIGAAAASAIAGYVGSKRFVAGRLRYVDGAQSRALPFIAGALAALIAWPVTWILPLVGTGTALLFGVAVALGVSSGAMAIRTADYKLLGS
jgi:hypothetical protein